MHNLLAITKRRRLTDGSTCHLRAADSDDDTAMVVRVRREALMRVCARVRDESQRPRHLKSATGQPCALK